MEGLWFFLKLVNLAESGPSGGTWAPSWQAAGPLTVAQTLVAALALWRAGGRARGLRSRGARAGLVAPQLLGS